MKKRLAILFLLFFLFISLLGVPVHSAALAKLLLSPIKRYNISFDLKDAKIRLFKDLTLYDVKLLAEKKTSIKIDRARIYYNPWNFLSGNFIFECDLKNVAIFHNSQKEAVKFHSAYITLRYLKSKLAVDWLNAASEDSSVCGYGSLGKDSVDFNLKVLLSRNPFSVFILPQVTSDEVRPYVIFLRVMGDFANPSVKIISEKLKLDFKSNRAS